MKKQARIVMLENAKMASMIHRVLKDLGLKHTFFRNEADDTQAAYIVHYYCDLPTHNLVISMLEADAMLDFYKL